MSTPSAPPCFPSEAELQFSLEVAIQVLEELERVRERVSEAVQAGTVPSWTAMGRIAVYAKDYHGYGETLCNRAAELGNSILYLDRRRREAARQVASHA